VWGYSLGALTATSLAVRHPAKVRRLVLAASNIRPDGYHPEITAPEQEDPRLPTEEEYWSKSEGPECPYRRVEGARVATRRPSTTRPALPVPAARRPNRVGRASR
jgi:pimeloyl-ACP methyl ester carboxylesterase